MGLAYPGIRVNIRQMIPHPFCIVQVIMGVCMSPTHKILIETAMLERKEPGNIRSAVQFQFEKFQHEALE
jgi:hypothetical protein